MVGNQDTYQSEKTNSTVHELTEHVCYEAWEATHRTCSGKSSSTAASASNARPYKWRDNKHTMVVTYRQDRFKCLSLIIQSNVHDALPGSTASKNAQHRNKTSKSSARKMYAWKTFVLNNLPADWHKTLHCLRVGTDAERRCVEAEVSHGDTADRPPIIVKHLKRESNKNNVGKMLSTQRRMMIKQTQGYECLKNALERRRLHTRRLIVG